MKKWLKKITGIELYERTITEAKMQAEEAIRIAEEAEHEARKRLEEAELAALSPKEKANKMQEPWVAVLDTKINPDNVRNGFFELDWNEFFIKELIVNGYGTEADPQEEIVDRWFRDIVYNMFAEEGVDTTRNSGYINVVPISKGKSQVS
jgi:hypothetical protein